MRPRSTVLFGVAAVFAMTQGAASGGDRRPPSPSGGEGSIVALRAQGPDRVAVPAGTFVMGSTGEEIEYAVTLCKRELHGDERCEKLFVNELEAHEVTLSAYSIDRTEVTVAAYRRCVDLGRCSAPPYASGGQRFNRPDYPVTLVTWNDADDYCRFDGGRLPTEAEWERAARGLNGRRYPWGNFYNKSFANHGAFGLSGTDDGDGFAELAPVASFPAGRTPDGIDDLAGNVEEWVYDAIDDFFGAHYPAASEVNPRGAPAGAFRVARGGSYQAPATGAPWLRGASRRFRPASERDTTRGFRCVHPANEGL